MTDLRITRTYRMLTDAFTRLLDEKRFEEITVSELCDEAMIRRTTFYKHFADRYEFFAFYLRRMSDSFEARGGVATTSLREYEVHMVRELMAFVDGHRNLVKSVQGSSMALVLFDMLTDHIARDVAERLRAESGLVPRGVSPEVVSFFYAGGLIRMLQWWLAQGERRLPEEALLSQVDALLDLLHPAAGNAGAATEARGCTT